MKITILDDEEGAIFVLKRNLLSLDPNHEIHSFTKYDEFLNFMYSNTVDVAFLDICMPGMTGLEVAKRVKKINPNTNIIFTTGFSEYAVEAIKLRSSGYLMKPVTKADLKEELSHLRNPVSEKASSEKSGVFMKTFGYFDCFVNGKPISFHREKSKELLAILVDKNGSTVTRKDIASAMFSDEEYTRSTQSYISNIIKSLRDTLKEAGIADIFDFNHNCYFLNKEKFSCDAYDYFAGDVEAINSFNGEYMEQYEWASYSIDKFYE